MPQLGTERLGTARLGIQGDVQTISFSSSSQSSLTQDVEATFSIENPIQAASTVESTLTGTFFINLKTQRRRLGENILGNSRLGAEAEFKSDSSLSGDIQRSTPIEFETQSQSGLTQSVQRVKLISLTSESISTFSLTLSPSSYEELFGIERGNAEDDLIVRGDAEQTIIVFGNAEID